MERPIGLILAGGQARRLGGGDKSLLHLGARTILEGIVERIEPQCTVVALSIRGDASRWRAYRSLIIPDTVEPAAGPLGGVLAGLHFVAKTAGSDGWLLTVPGDTPFLPLDLVARFAEVRQRTGAPICRAASNGRIHPVVALWSAAMLPLVHRALTDRDRLSVAGFQAEVGSATAEWIVEGHDPFFNVNTPNDLKEAVRLTELTPCVS